jgi:GNAT superfamily N-acetyltransferase
VTAIAREPFDAPDSRVLLDELAADLQYRYGRDSEPGPKPTARDMAAFLVARDGAGEAVGCVGLLLRDPATAEIKRMYVRPNARGTGLARRLLDAIEDQAARLGARRVILETGLAQPEAIALYRAAGYYPIAPFGVYADSPLSRCFARDLVEPARRT